jgi:hypothetical protein
MFLRSVNSSSDVKNAHLLFHLLDEVMWRWVCQIIVHVIIDNASNYVSTSKMFEEKHPTIF